MQQRFRAQSSHSGAQKSWAGGLLQAGRGTIDLHIGQSVQEVENCLGKPDLKESSDGQYFSIYYNLGVDVDFSSTDDRVQRLFFFLRGIESHSVTAPVRLQGIKLGISRAEIENKMGRPDGTGGPLCVGNKTKSWIWYESGVQFEFDPHSVLILITIFDRRLTPQQ